MHTHAQNLHMINMKHDISPQTSTINFPIFRINGTLLCFKASSVVKAVKMRIAKTLNTIKKQEFPSVSTVGEIQCLHNSLIHPEWRPVEIFSTGHNGDPFHLECSSANSTACRILRKWIEGEHPALSKEQAWGSLPLYQANAKPPKTKGSFQSLAHTNHTSKM